MPALTEPILIVDGAHGDLVPKVWAKVYGSMAPELAEVDPNDVAILRNGPDADGYWEAWTNVLVSYCHKVNGVKHYMAEVDGHLWKYPETFRDSFLSLLTQ